MQYQIRKTEAEPATYYAIEIDDEGNEKVLCQPTDLDSVKSLPELDGQEVDEVDEVDTRNTKNSQSDTVVPL